MSAVLRMLHVVMALLFCLSIAVQYNDPDPIAWVCIYGAALGQPGTGREDRTK